MTNQQMRAAFLEATYNAARKAGSIGGGIVAVSTIVKDWEEDSKRIYFNIDYLIEKGWIERPESGDVICITVDGVDEYEREHGPGDYGKHGCLADENR